MENWYWRSVLFVPASRPDRCAKAMASGADAVCIDLEDAVSSNEKDRARVALMNMLARLDATAATRVLIRINGLGTPWHAEDMRMLRSVPDGIWVMLPKADEPELAIVSPSLQRPIAALVETPAALENAYKIAAFQGVRALALGGVDLSLAMGAELSWAPFLYARSRIVAAAATANIFCIDTPSLVMDDPESLRHETQRIRTLGMDTKMAIHPAQLAPIHEAFVPTEDEVTLAHEVLAAFAHTDGGAVQVRGMMVDVPVAERARRILALAERRA